MPWLGMKLLSSSNTPTPINTKLTIPILRRGWLSSWRIGMRYSCVWTKLGRIFGLALG